MILWVKNEAQRAFPRILGHEASGYVTIFFLFFFFFTRNLAAIRSILSKL